MFLFAFFTVTCAFATPAARAGTCTLSSESATYYMVLADDVQFTLKATVSGGGGTVSYTVTAVPTYYNSSNQVVSSTYTDLIESGGSSTFPFSIMFNASPNPRPEIVASAPTGAVSYTYHYYVAAQVVVMGVIVASDHWQAQESGSY